MSENKNSVMVNFAIPQNFIDSISENSAPGNYIKITKDGKLEVTVGGDVRNLSEIKGIITATDYYHAKFTEGRFVRWDTAAPPSDGYQMRVDVALQVGPDTSLVLQLSKTSVTPLMNYVLSLNRKGFAPNQVMTTVRAKTVVGKFGQFGVALFEESPLQAQQMKNVTPVQIADVQPTFTPPQTAPSTSQIPSAWL
jgi:hypothetical protein